MIDEERNAIACLYQQYDQSWVDAVMVLSEDNFTDSTHVRLFTKARDAINAHGSARPSILSEEDATLVRKWQLTMTHPATSVSLLITEAKRRKTIEYCRSAAQAMVNGDPNKILAHLQNLLDGLNKSIGGDPKLASEYLRSLIAQLSDANRTGVGTGIADFDAYIKGFLPGQMVVIAGRPGQGKSVLASQVATATALSGKPALMFNFEMSGEELVGRIISGELGINSEMIANRDLFPSQLDDIKSRADMLDGLPLFIDPETSHTINSIRSVARKYKRKHDIGLIVVDYLQLIAEERDKGENREQVVARMSRSFKVLAKELDIPVIILSQLSRESDKRATKEPQLSDLRESGAIEQDADVVMFVHRPETYDIQTFDDGTSTAGVVVIKVAKRRNGPLAHIRLRFNAKHQRIEGLNEAL